MFAKGGCELPLHFIQQGWGREADRKGVHEAIDAGPEGREVVDDVEVIGSGRLVAVAKGCRKGIMDGGRHFGSGVDGGFEAFRRGVMSLPVGGRENEDAFGHLRRFSDGCVGTVSGV